MKKFFLVVLIALIVSVQNFCGAAKIYEEHYNGNANLIYPVVQTGDAAVDKKINDAIFTEINRFVASIYATAQSNGYEVADIRTRYEIACNEASDKAILSILITESSYFKGAAHPSTNLRAMNFNTNDGAVVTMELFKKFAQETGINEQMLKSVIGQKLNEHCQRKGTHLFNDALPLKKLPKEFYWDENLHIHFIFNHYEVAPYAAGIIDVDMD